MRYLISSSIFLRVQRLSFIQFDIDSNNMKKLEEIDGEIYLLGFRLGFDSKRSVKVSRFEPSCSSFGKKFKEFKKVTRIRLYYRGIQILV
ncbi:hypothetical protein LguiB_004079 [Lonicera macranthoides]